MLRSSFVPRFFLAPRTVEQQPLGSGFPVLPSRRNAPGFRTWGCKAAVRSADETLDDLAYGRIIQNMGSNNGWVSYQSNRNVVYSCKYEVVWCPKYRSKVLIEPIAARLKSLLREVAAEPQARGLELELTPALACGASVPAHVHLLCEVDPQPGIHRLVRPMKGGSSGLMRQEFGSWRSRLPRLWTNSYFVSSCGDAPLAVIKQYIEDQNNV